MPVTSAMHSLKPPVALSLVREHLDLPALASRRSARTCGRGRPRRAPPPRRPPRSGSRGWCSSCRWDPGGRSRSWIELSRRPRSACELRRARRCASSRSSGSRERLLVVADLLLDVAVARERVDDRLEIAPLLVELRERAVGQHLRPAEQLLELAVAARKLLELVDREHQAARAGAVSGREARRREQRLVARERHVVLGRAWRPRWPSTEQRHAQARQRDLELRVVGLGRRDLLHEKPRHEEHAERTGRAVPREEPLEFERDRDEHGEKRQLLEEEDRRCRGRRFPCGCAGATRRRP